MCAVIYHHLSARSWRRYTLFRSTFFLLSLRTFLRASRKKRNSFATPSVNRAKHHQNFPCPVRRIVPRGIRRTRVTLSRMSRDEECFYIRARSLDPRDPSQCRYSMRPCSILRYLGYSRPSLWCRPEIPANVLSFVLHRTLIAMFDRSRGRVPEEWNPRWNFFIWPYSIAHCALFTRFSRFAVQLFHPRHVISSSSLTYSRSC